MSFLSFLKEGFKQKQLIPTIFRTKPTLQSVESQEEQLQQSLTFFNRIIQQMNIINLNKNITNVSSEQYIESPSMIEIYSYIPNAASSQIHNIDPVFTIQNIEPKLLKYQLQSISLNRCNIQEHINLLQQSVDYIQQQVSNILQHNHKFIYASFIGIQQSYSQLLLLSQSINGYRSNIKSSLFQTLLKYVRLKTKSMTLKILQAKLQFMNSFKQRIGIIYLQNTLLFQKILAVNRNLEILNTSSKMFESIISLKGLKNKCIQIISLSSISIDRLIKSSILQKHIPTNIQDIILSSYLLHYLFRQQKYKVLFELIDKQLNVILQFVKNPSDSSNIKQYLQIIYKYTNNINKFKLFIKQIKTTELKQKLYMLQKNDIVEYYRQIRQQIDIKLNTFFAEIYQILGGICKQVIINGKEDDKKVIKKFVEMIDADHHSEGFKDFKNNIKLSFKK